MPTGYKEFGEDVKACLEATLNQYSLLVVKERSSSVVLQNDFYKIIFAIDRLDLDVYLRRNDSGSLFLLNQIKNKIKVNDEILKLPFYYEGKDEAFRNMFRWNIITYNSSIKAFFNLTKEEQNNLLTELEKENNFLSKLAKAVMAHAPIGHPLRVNLFEEGWKEKAEAFLRESNISLDAKQT